MKKLRYIINPKSGANRKTDFPEMINRLTDKSKYEFDISFTDAPKHATELSQEAAQKNYNVVVAVGGDGSVNETGKGLIGSETALGFIATGSGNGMARHLKIPMKYEKAIDVLNTGKIDRIDSMMVNNEFCIGTIGIGFDAHVAHLFANSAKRGYATYVKLVLSEFYKYHPKKFDISIDGKEFSKECFLLTFANSSQFGNNACIAPFANVKDGIMDISMMKKFPFFFAPHLIYRLMNNDIQNSRFFSRAAGKNIVVKNPGTLLGHIDGEPVTFTGDLQVQIIPDSINVLVP